MLWEPGVVGSSPTPHPNIPDVVLMVARKIVVLAELVRIQPRGPSKVLTANFKQMVNNMFKCTLLKRRIQQISKWLKILSAKRS